jgi:hypothetical protein
MDHFLWAASNIDKLSPKACRTWAMENYSCDRVVLKYEEYFQMLYDVRFGKGYYEIHQDRTNLDWLKVHHESELTTATQLLHTS